MKIRTDFVTNSSSVSTAEVVIDNPVLLEILQKYKDMGTFDLRCPDFAIGNYNGFGSVPEKVSKTPALSVWLSEDSWGNVPSNLTAIVESILDGLRGGYAIKEENLFTQMKNELEGKQKEIDTAYKHVAWKRSYSCNDDDDYYGEMEETELFTFDPLTGEDYHFTKVAGMGEDEVIEEGFVFAEKHVVNGEVIVDFQFDSEDEGEDDEESEDEDYDE